MKRILLFSIATWAIHVSGFAQILSNGSFEQDWATWSTNVRADAAATFSLDNANAHAGSKAAKVSVTQTGTDIEAVRLQHEAFNPSGDSVHLLTFWAKTSVESAEVTINIQGTSVIPCRFKLRNVWHKYLFPFKSNETSLVLKFFMHSQSDYFIDDIEILNQESSVIDVRTLYRWHYKPQTFGLQATDNDISILLPDGRRVWFFNDTFLGTNNPYDNILQQNHFARNAMVVESPNGVMTTINHGTLASPQDFLVPAYPPPPGYPATAVNLYWVGDAVIDGGKLKLILIEVIDPRNGSGTVGTGRRDLATFSLPSLTLEGVQPLPNTGTDSYEAIIEDDDYWYFYAWISQGFDSWTKLARATKGNIAGDVTPWQFYNNGNWVTDYAQASNIVSNRGASATTKLGPNNYAMIAMPPLSGRVDVLFANNPVGPWTEPLLLYQVPTEDPYWTYMPNLHGDRYGTGKYTISYSTNTFEGWFTNPGPFGDKYHYLPRYLYVDLKKLSPYTNTDLALNKPVTVSTASGTNTGALAVDNNLATRWESAYSDPQWIYVDLGDTYAINRVRITWHAAYAKNYDVQVSHDKRNWTTVKSVINNTTTINDHFELSGSGRYVRVRGMARNTTSGYSIISLQVFGMLDTTPDAVTDVEAVQLSESPAPHPVPFAQRVSIPVFMPQPGEARINVYDSSGRPSIAMTRKLAAGHHFITWDGNDTQNNKVKPGLYVVKVQTGKKTTTYKIIKE